MPLPSTKLIPDGWDDHHRPVATATMTATCIVGPSSPGALDPVTLQYGAPTIEALYTGSCRVQQLRGEAQNTQSGGQSVTSLTYLVAIEYDADPGIEVDHVVHVTDSVDAALVGRKLRVREVRYGSNQWQRDLFCDDWLG